MSVACSRTVGNHGHGQIGGVSRVVTDLYVEHSGEAAETLCADAQMIDSPVQLDAHLFDLAGGPAGDDFLNVDRLHQRFLGEQHGLLRGPADADAEHSGRAPSGAHSGNGFEHPVNDGVGRIEHDEFGFRLRSSTFGRDGNFDFAATNQLDVDDGRGIVTSVLAGEGGIGENRSAQLVVRVHVGAANAFIHHFFDGQLRIPPHIHADLEEDSDDACVLANRPMALGAHA